MSEIKITVDDVILCANEIRKYNNKLDEVLSFVKKTMNDLNAVWESDASKTLQERFNQFALRFIDESEEIENYARYLDYTASSYDSLETTLNNNASSFE